MDKKKLKNILSSFKTLKVLVIGDCMMDYWVWGTVNRISPEAPVPVVEVDSYSFTPGGAANVVNNLCALGAKVSLSGVIGKDFIGKLLKKDLRAKGVDVKGIVEDKGRPTTLKTRIVAHNQQVVRTDYEKIAAVPKNTIDQLLVKIDGNIKSYDAVLISDYAKGMLCKEFVDELISKCRKSKVKIIAGPKPVNIDLFKDADCISLNKSEAASASGITIKDEKSLFKAGQALLDRTCAGAIIITRGEEGMSIFEKGKKPVHVPALASQVYDVSGAGDTVVSVFSLAVASGASVKDAAVLSNYAASIVVRKVGTATVTTDELKEVLK
ncbi:MAG: D-glycero-beta-D-manno-heptose-7-phosphate kinase [Armatimonadota bacterium]